MKFYQAEKEAHEFMNGYHTLKEWANFGFNKVYYSGKWYYDGCEANGKRITDEENEEAGLLEWTEKDYDEDGYLYLILNKVI